MNYQLFLQLLIYPFQFFLIMWKSIMYLLIGNSERSNIQLKVSHFERNQ